MTHTTNPGKTRLSRRSFVRTGVGAATLALSVPAFIGNAAAHFPPTLDIDIVPDCDENTIDLSNDRTIPVAVLYTTFEDENGNTVVFDPTKRAVRYRFGAPDAVEKGNGAQPTCHYTEDVNNDGHDDLVLHFLIKDIGFSGDETEGVLHWLRHENGEHGYSGTDSVMLVGSEMASLGCDTQWFDAYRSPSFAVSYFR